jgi:DNA mismatch repair protein MutS
VRRVNCFLFLVLLYDVPPSAHCCAELTDLRADLRQNATLAIMAQAGSFVPARRLQLAPVDAIFSRVGAADDLSNDRSTFMMEMLETSAILREATSRSLVIMDEIGRGTSTHDGLAIAWAVAEHLHDSVGCRTLFATHYHEMSGLADELVGGAAKAMGVHRMPDGDVLFLYSLGDATGGECSLGVHIAQLAGLPTGVVGRAEEILELLEERSGTTRALGGLIRQAK